MFIGGLSWDTTEDTMKKYFSQYGEVEACQTMSLKDENGLVIKPRGFGFVTFRDDESVDSVGNTKEHILDGKTVCATGLLYVFACIVYTLVFCVLLTLTTQWVHICTRKRIV